MIRNFLGFGISTPYYILSFWGHFCLLSTKKKDFEILDFKKITSI
jgi:hypothetical protein